MEAPCEVTRVVRAAYSTKNHHRGPLALFYERVTVHVKDAYGYCFTVNAEKKKSVFIK